MRHILAALALCSTAAGAQVANPPGTTGLATQAQITALQASIPVMATTTPTCIADVAMVGGVTNQFAPANHTHCSKIRKSRITGVTTATYSWTYPTAFTTGVIPICQALVEDPANSATDSYNVQVAGVPTATAVTFRIVRQSTGLLSLLTGALSLNATPGTVNLHLTCFEP